MLSVNKLYLEAIDSVMFGLNNGLKRAEIPILISKHLEPIAEITGYWVKDIMRIDIKFKENQEDLMDGSD